MRHCSFRLGAALCHDLVQAALSFSYGDVATRGVSIADGDRGAAHVGIEALAGLKWSGADFFWHDVSDPGFGINWRYCCGKSESGYLCRDLRGT